MGFDRDDIRDGGPLDGPADDSDARAGGDADENGAANEDGARVRSDGAGYGADRREGGDGDDGQPRDDDTLDTDEALHPREGAAEDDERRNVLQRAARRAIQQPGDAYQFLFYVGVVAFVLITMFPFYWLLVIALTPLSMIDQIYYLKIPLPDVAVPLLGALPEGLPILPLPAGFDPSISFSEGFNPNAFVEAFQIVPFHRYMFNSIFIALITTVIVLVIASLAGYAFGRLEFKGRRVLLVTLLAVSYFPPVTFALPLFRFFTGNIHVLTIPGVEMTIPGVVTMAFSGWEIYTPNWFNTPNALITPFSALFMPLAIFILTTFYSQIPDGLEDAARIEGTTRIGALFRVIVPLSAPGVATAGVLTFITVYNEFFFSFLLTNGAAENWAPIVWGILGYRGQYAEFYNLMAAASIVGVVPVAILVVVAQEKIVSGLTSGALKE